MIKVQQEKKVNQNFAPPKTIVRKDRGFFMSCWQVGRFNLTDKEYKEFKLMVDLPNT